MSSDTRRALVFLLYDEDGLCDRSTQHTLAGLRPFVEHLLVVVNGTLAPEARADIAKIADEILERKNVGYDVGAYRSAFAHIGWDRLASYDEVLLVNYTFFGPVTSFDELFARMDSKDVDFWGMTNHPAVTPHPFTGKDTMAEHLQSYWLVLRQKMVSDRRFREYWENLPEPQSYEDIIIVFEAAFTEYFAGLGFTWCAAYPAANYGGLNSTMEAAVALLDDGCPIFKKRLYFHDMPMLALQGTSAAEVTRAAVSYGYPEELIVAGARRRASARSLSIGMDALYVRPDGPESHDSRVLVRAERPWAALDQGRLPEIMGEADIWLVDAEEPHDGDRSDGELLRMRRSRQALIVDTCFTASIFEEHKSLAALFPIVQTLTRPAVGRDWVIRTEKARDVATELGLAGPFGATSVTAPYRGVAAYRRDFLLGAQKMIDDAGGWARLSGIAGGDDHLESILDCLAGDMAKDMDYFVGQIATSGELRATWDLMQDVYSRKPFIYPDYVDYAYAGYIVRPTFKNQVGQRLLNSSPRLYDSLHAVQKRVRRFLGPVRRMIRRG